MNQVDLETPQIIEELSLNEILEQMRDKLISIEPEFSAYLESDPLIKLMEVAAYRELLLRQRINQTAKANLLAFATESDLDHLAAFYGITRKENESKYTTYHTVQEISIMRYRHHDSIIVIQVIF